MAGCENDGWLVGGIVLLAGWVAVKRWLMPSYHGIVLLTG